MHILLTGSTGYIGSHTLVDLTESGYDVLSLDNLSRSSPEVLANLQHITGKPINHANIDLCDFESLRSLFNDNPDLKGIVHFAAYKSVGESVENPLLYYKNNLLSLINLLQCAKEFGISYFVFSSSCTVYGNPSKIPVTEEAPLGQVESPYGATKQMGEQIIRDFVAAHPSMKAVLLRYFNPAGAHPNGMLGEQPVGRPQNLVPVITQTAIGKLPVMQVFGTDYPTRDGSCVRDFIHVCDLAQAHTLALRFLMEGNSKGPLEIFNLGTGNGVSVLEAIHAFEKVSNVKLNYALSARRPGDIVAIYANNDRARRLLNWRPNYALEDIMATAWAWEIKREGR